MALQMLKTCARRSDHFDKSPFDRRSRYLQQRRSLAHSLPIVRQDPGFTHNVRFVYPQRVHVTNKRSNIANIRGIFDNGNEALTAQRTHPCCPLPQGRATSIGIRHRTAPSEKGAVTTKPVAEAASARQCAANALATWRDARRAAAPWKSGQALSLGPMTHAPSIFAMVWHVPSRLSLF
jgi:hypothetical protein